MVIQYIGHACFKIKGKDVTILTDPYNPEIGKSFPKQNEIDILLTSHDHSDHHYLEGVTGDYFLIEGPGEYDVKNVSINGIFSYHDKKKGSDRGSNTIYVIDLEGVTLCHLGDLGHLLDEEQIEKIGNVDILFIPVGGKYTIDSSEAVKVISEIEPKLVIPMHYGNKKLGLEDVDAFLKEMGVERESAKNIKVSKEDFSDSSEGSRVLVLES